MQSYIYRSEKKTDCYLYLNKPIADFVLPQPVLKVVGDLYLVMELEIQEDTKLALSDPKIVLAAMNEQGFYIQMPSKEPHPVDVLFERLFEK
jgi:uncharacterized protein YcgL (UPF0745 family)